MLIKKEQLTSTIIGQTPNELNATPIRSPVTILEFIEHIKLPFIELDLIRHELDAMLLEINNFLKAKNIRIPIVEPVSAEDIMAASKQKSLLFETDPKKIRELLFYIKETYHLTEEADEIRVFKDSDLYNNLYKKLVTQTLPSIILKYETCEDNSSKKLLNEYKNRYIHLIQYAEERCPSVITLEFDLSIKQLELLRRLTRDIDRTKLNIAIRSLQKSSKASHYDCFNDLLNHLAESHSLEGFYSKTKITTIGVERQLVTKGIDTKNISEFVASLYAHSYSHSPQLRQALFSGARLLWHTWHVGKIINPSTRFINESPVYNTTTEPNPVEFKVTLPDRLTSTNINYILGNLYKLILSRGLHPSYAALVIYRTQLNCSTSTPLEVSFITREPQVFPNVVFTQTDPLERALKKSSKTTDATLIATMKKLYPDDYGKLCGHLYTMGCNIAQIKLLLKRPECLNQMREGLSYDGLVTELIGPKFPLFPFSKQSSLANVLDSISKAIENCGKTTGCVRLNRVFFFNSAMRYHWPFKHQEDPEIKHTNDLFIRPSIISNTLTERLWDIVCHGAINGAWVNANRELPLLVNLQCSWSPIVGSLLKIELKVEGEIKFTTPINLSR